MRNPLSRLGFVFLGTCIAAMFLSGCGAPSTFQKGNPSGWKSIALRDELTRDYDKAWQTTVDTIARNWDIEIMDKDSGYLRTAWQHGISGVSGSVAERYAGRLTIKYPSVRVPVSQVELKTEARWYTVNAWTHVGYWVTGWDTNYHRDVFDALSGRLGRTAPTQ